MQPTIAVVHLQVVEAQAELAERLPAETLAFLRNRGAVKARMQLAGAAAEALAGPSPTASSRAAAGQSSPAKQFAARPAGPRGLEGAPACYLMQLKQTGLQLELHNIVSMALYPA